jgi:tetratricopeptide (TPR) repeat protein
MNLNESMMAAASLEIAGRTEEAVAELCRARDAGLGTPALYSALGHLHFELGRYGAAAEAYEAISGDLMALFNRAVCLEKLGEWATAAIVFQEVVDRDPRRSGALLGLGISLLHLGRPLEALDALERSLERQPFREAALRGKAAALQQVGRHEEALELYQTLLLRGRDEDLLAQAMASAAAVGDYDRIEGWSRRWLELRPDAEQPLECLALAAFARRDFAAAAAFSQTLLDRNPENFAAWFNLGVALQELGKQSEAADAYARAAQIEPQSAEAHLGYGAALHELGKVAEAQAAYENALALEPRLRPALWNLALLHETRGEFGVAAQLYTWLAELHPEDGESWFRLGYSQFQLEDFPAALRAFESCLALSNKRPDAVLNLAVVQWRTGALEEARETLRPVLAAEVKPAGALRCLAAMAVERQDFKQASALFQQLLEAEGSGPELLYNAGLASQKLGRAADAAAYYRKALEQRPEFPEAHLNLGHALMASGEYEEARSCWQAAARGNLNLAEHFLV